MWYNNRIYKVSYTYKEREEKREMIKRKKCINCKYFDKVPLHNKNNDVGICNKLVIIFLNDNVGTLNIRKDDSIPEDVDFTKWKRFLCPANFSCGEWKDKQNESFR